MSAAASAFRLPGARPMFAAGAIGRLPMGMVGLGLTLLIVGQSGSYTLAGAVSATMTIAIALVGPYAGRLIDRLGQTRAIPLLLAGNVASFLLLTAAVALQWPTPLWFAFAASAGATMPQLGAMTRARWTHIARDSQQRSSAFALESVADELAFMVGPVLASFLALQYFDAAPILFGLAALSIGGLALAAQRGTAPPPSRREAKHASGHVLQFDGVGSLFGLMLALGAMFGLLNLSVVAFAEGSDPALTGVLLAAISTGSLISGVILGMVTRTWQLATQVRISSLTLALAVLPLALISSPKLFVVVAFGAGLSVSTTMIGGFGLAERMVPKDRLTESLTFMGSGLSLGMAGGTWAAGALIDSLGSSASLFAAGLCALAAAAQVWSRGARLSGLESHADKRELAMSLSAAA